MLGKVKATLKASLAWLAPSTRAADHVAGEAEHAADHGEAADRADRLDQVHGRAPLAPLPGQAWPVTSPAWPPVASACCCGRALHVEAGEIDRVEQQRREAAVDRGVGDDLAGEREQEARRLGEQEGLELLGGHVPEREQAGIEQLDAEGDALVGLGGDLDLEHDLVHVLADALGADVELDVHLRLALPLDRPPARSDSRTTGPSHIGR